MSSVLRNIPSVGELLESAPLKSLVARVNRSVVVSGVRRFLDDLRTQAQSAAATVHVPSAGELAQRIADWIATEAQPSLRPVINATGIVLHPHLGRVPLAEEAITAMAAASRGYANVDLDLACGERTQRTLAVERLLMRLCGAEAATVVNNNAAATLVTLAALARGREVIVSRGQLAEIGGDYRLPEIVAASGAILCEVGTTNATRIGDFAAAITPQTAALLRVRPTNFEVIGGTDEVSLAELVMLGRKHGLPVIDDLGNGALVDLACYGIRGEPIVGDSIRAGADLVHFSGDKLLGGPQCGIVVGRRALVEQLDRHPLLRTLRVDKLTLAALAATLQLYQDPDLAERSIPVLTLLAAPLENLQHRAERLAPQLAATGVATVAIVTGHAYLSGDPLPNQSIPTVSLALKPVGGSAEALAAALRCGKPAVVGRLEVDQVLLDLRSVQPRDDAQLVAALAALRREKPAESTETPQLPPP